MTFLFGTVGTPISTPKKPGGSIGAIQELYNLGLSALELGWVRSVNMSEESCLAIQAAARSNSVFLSVHASYYINLYTQEENWQQHRQRLLSACRLGKLAGATDIIFHPGSYMGMPSQTVLPVVVTRLNEIQNFLCDSGISVTLRPETMGKPALIGSLSDVFMICSEVNNCLPCLDFPHLFARSEGDTPNSVGDFLEILDGYQSAFGKASLQSLHIHLSGIEFSKAGEKKHLPLEDSKFNYKDLLIALKELNCCGRILCESPSMEKDALLLKGFWELLL